MVLLSPRRFCALAIVSSSILASPSALLAGVIYSTTFNDESPASAAFSRRASPDSVTAGFTLTADGTIDTYRGPRTPALALTADFSRTAPGARASVHAGPFTIANTESDLARLTFSFDLWSRTTHAVRVYLQSCDRDGAVTGTRTAVVVPPVAGAFYRFNIDLDRTTSVSGTFDPLAPGLRYAFELNDADDTAPLPRDKGAVLRIDNISYTAPSFYVSPRGDDFDEGRTTALPFATVRRAVGAAKPGDVILVMDGTYESESGAMLAEINKAGTPDKWIVLRAHPGHQPVLTGDGWNVIGLNQDAAYIELRDLTIRGQRKKYTVEQALADSKSPAEDSAKFNTNGLSLDSRKGTEDNGKAHHIRFINCTVADMPGGGIAAIAGDHITVEGNHIYDNAHLMRFAGSGISVFRAWDFDTDTGYKNFVLNNRAHGNRCYIPWGVVGRISDGNGIIIDDFINYQPGASNIPYKGRTLVANNLTFGNGGSGIHAYAANHVDIVNNTAYHNAQSPELVWRQIFAGGKSKDVRVVNNILYAQRGRPLNFSVSKDSSEIVYAHNLSFGDGDNDVQSGGGLGTGAAGGGLGDKGGNVRGDPRFLRASLDPVTADFHIAPGSPAIDAGTSSYPFIPSRDLEARVRPQGKSIDIGAYEKAD